MSSQNIILALFALALLALTAYAFFQRKKMADATKQDAEKKDDQLVSNLTNQFSLLQQALGTMQKSVDQRLGENTSRLDNASRSYAEVQKQIVHLQTEVKRVHDIGKNISSLEDILRAPKLRGVMGEFLLENLLSQIFSREHVEFQHQFKSGEKVDAVVRLKEYVIPVDSKFPLENFRKGSGAGDQATREQYGKLFYQDVKKHIDSIAKKYILPDEGTVDFALMYIPAENVYHEIISNEFGGFKLFDYATSKRVIPVSPNTLYAYLSTIIMGLRGMKVEENAKIILENLKQLEIEFGKVRNDYALLGTHLSNAAKKYADMEKGLNRFDAKLENSSARGLNEGVAGDESDMNELARIKA